MNCACARARTHRHGKHMIAAGLMTSALLAIALAATATTSLVQDSAGARMTRAAREFLTSLDADQKKSATFEFSDKERTNWNFVPLQDKERKPTRKGLRLELLSPAQKEKALALLRAGTSDRGYQSALDIMALESVLNRQEKPGGNVRSPAWYFVSIFGDPGSDAAWGWRWEGHHLALNFTLSGSQVTGTTPAFFGANPAEVRSGPEKGKVSIEGCSSLALKLIASLSPEQAGKGSTTKAGAEIDQAQTKPPVQALTGEGISAAEFNPDQSATFTQLLREYTGRLPAELEAREWSLVKSFPPSAIKFQYFRNTSAKGNPTTYRVEAPGFLIQYLNVQADGEGNPANHIHSAFRHVAGDFGNPAR